MDRPPFIAHWSDLEGPDDCRYPAGTGIAHTFLNNSQADALLLVGGQSLDHNRITYRLHPARNAECREKGWLWEDAPERPLGDHDGLPDRLRAAPVDPPQTAPDGS